MSVCVCVCASQVNSHLQCHKELSGFAQTLYTVAIQEHTTCTIMYIARTTSIIQLSLL